jgi:transposase
MTLEVADATGSQRRSFPNTPTGSSQMLAWLLRRFPEEALHLVLEPTNTYHQQLIQTLAEQGTPYTLLNPARTKAFARSLGKRAKTDRVDARLLAQLGESQQLQPSQPPDAAKEQLKSLRRHLEWVEQELQGAKNRLAAASVSPWTPEPVRQSLKRTIGQLEGEAQQLREAIEELVKADPELSAQIALLTSIPGVGQATALLLLSELPPVERCAGAKQWVAFCGLNPEPRESGKSRTSRLCRVGSALVRAKLYLPGASALRWNPVVKALGERLKAQGKVGRVRVVAAMHKLLRLCFGVLKSARPFDLSLHQATLPA